MRFLRRHPAPAPAPRPVAEVSRATPDSTLEQVALFLGDRIEEGWIETRGARVSDVLPTADPIIVRTLDAVGAAASHAFPADDVIAVAAPPSPPSALRVSRRRHQVAISAGPYTFTGRVHMLPGSSVDRQERPSDSRSDGAGDCAGCDRQRQDGRLPEWPLDWHRPGHQRAVGHADHYPARTGYLHADDRLLRNCVHLEERAGLAGPLLAHRLRVGRAELTSPCINPAGAAVWRWDRRRQPLTIRSWWEAVVARTARSSRISGRQRRPGLRPLGRRSWPLAHELFCLPELAGSPTMVVLPASFGCGTARGS
jgi:hypothetical protein